MRSHVYKSPSDGRTQTSVQRPDRAGRNPAERGGAGITPDEERRSCELQKLAEYQDALACLEALTIRIHDFDESFIELRSVLDRQSTLTYIPNRILDATDNFRETVENYTTVRARCLSLNETLTRLNLGGAIREVPRAIVTLDRQA